MKRMLPALLFAAAFSPPAGAIDYRTVDAATVLYDAPSQRGGKLFVIRRDTPVEVVVSLEGWSKVRDAEGGLAWIEKRYLAERRSVIVTADRAEVRQKAEEGSPLVFEAEKNVALDYLETLPGGWIKVRHRDGPSGYVRVTQIWGS
jgi:SH3-like domain-containing protein